MQRYGTGTFAGATSVSNFFCAWVSYRQTHRAVSACGHLITQGVGIQTKPGKVIQRQYVVTEAS
jgi:hypothetical protein